MSNFCIVEKMGGEHPSNMYFERGSYSIKGDSLFFKVTGVGFILKSLIRKNYVKKGLIKRKTIFLLNEKGEYFLKLRKKKRFSVCLLCTGKGRLLSNLNSGH
jgi:hypothetical protein